MPEVPKECNKYFCREKPLKSAAPQGWERERLDQASSKLCLLSRRASGLFGLAAGRHEKQDT
jgi:hypothetical protein